MTRIETSEGNEIAALIGQYITLSHKEEESKRQLERELMTWTLKNTICGLYYLSYTLFYKHHVYWFLKKHCWTNQSHIFLTHIKRFLQRISIKEYVRSSVYWSIGPSIHLFFSNRESGWIKHGHCPSSSIFHPLLPRIIVRCSFTPKLK